MEKNQRGINPARSRVALGVWSAWRQQTVGGFIFAGVRSVGTSVAATVLLRVPANWESLLN